ncbi:hypothetical protein VNO77_22437 [Canavalia gladiata]|uniref:MADS-box domain-containing protein n=1 Tax=Canavalia gladiata TaxID=3824 RepID=A0AAN9L5U7_CANGL
MGRGRIPMELIQKEKARNITFQKRKNGLMKKVYEFSTLCGVDVCLIMYPSSVEGEGSTEPETWPQDLGEVQRIISKYHNTTNDRRPKVYDVHEYYKDRMKKIESEIFKIRKEKLKIMYPICDNSFNYLGEQQLRIFVSLLDAKLESCNQRLNMLKGKQVSEFDKANTFSPQSSNLNLISNMSQGQNFPPLMNPIGDNNLLPIYPFWGQSSQSPMLHFGENCVQLMEINGQVDLVNQVGTVPCDPKRDGTENNYYSGNIQTMVPASQYPEYETPFQNALPPAFQLNGLYDSNMLQPQTFNYLHASK